MIPKALVRIIIQYTSIKTRWNIVRQVCRFWRNTATQISKHDIQPAMSWKGGYAYYLAMTNNRSSDSFIVWFHLQISQFSCKKVVKMKIYKQKTCSKWPYMVIPAKTICCKQCGRIDPTIKEESKLQPVVELWLSGQINNNAVCWDCFSYSKYNDEKIELSNSH